MNNYLFSTSLPIIGINLILFYIAILLHESGQNLVRMKYTYSPNSKRHIRFDAIGSFLLPILSILSCAIPIGYSRMDLEDQYLSIKKQISILISGIFANLVLFSILVLLLRYFKSVNILTETKFAILIGNILTYLTSALLVIIVFNLFPIPPLDAGQVLMKSLNVKGEYYGIAGGFILLTLFYVGVLKPFLTKIYSFTILLINKNSALIDIVLIIVIACTVIYYMKFGGYRIKSISQENSKAHGKNNILSNT